MACAGGGWPGSRAVDEGAGGGVCLRSSCCVCAHVGRSALNRGPSWDSIIMISMGTGRASAVQMGKSEGDSSSL